MTQHDANKAAVNFSVKPLVFGNKTRSVYGYAGDIFFDALSQAAIQSTIPGGYGGFDCFCERYLQHDYVMLDIGANIGVTSLIASNYLADGKTVAIEASPRNCAALEHTFHANGIKNAIIVPFAVGAVPGKLQFNEAGAHGHVLTDSIALGRSGITVEVKTVDQIVAELNLPQVDFVKIDIEGFERDAIIGAERTIENWKPLFYIEFNSWCQIAVRDESPLRFYDFLLNRFDYVFRIEDTGLTRLNKGEGIHFLHQNIILHGCVEDVVASTSSGRFVESPTHLTECIKRLKAERDSLRAEQESLRAERDSLRAEHDRMATKLEKMKHSPYWRLSRPIRRIRKLVR